MKTKAKTLVGIVMLVVGGAVNAAQVGQNVTVTQIGATQNFGGCWAAVSPAFQGLDARCALPDYVMFDCKNLSGVTTKSEAQTKLSNAQLAFVTGYTTWVVVDDLIAIDGMCFADRVNVQSPQ